MATATHISVWSINNKSNRNFEQTNTKKGHSNRKQNETHHSDRHKPTSFIRPLRGFASSCQWETKRQNLRWCNVKWCLICFNHQMNQSKNKSANEAKSNQSDDTSQLQKRKQKLKRKKKTNTSNRKHNKNSLLGPTRTNIIHQLAPRFCIFLSLRKGQNLRYCYMMMFDLFHSSNESKQKQISKWNKK